MSLTTEEILERLKKLRDERGAVVQAANAQIAPLEAQMRELTEQKAVIVGNANLAVGRLDGEVKLLEELNKPPAEPPAEPEAQPSPRPAPLAAVPPIDEPATDTTTTPPEAEG